jgi:hypothetical protein
LGPCLTLVVGMSSRENRCMATRAWPWHRRNWESRAVLAKNAAFRRVLFDEVVSQYNVGL